jgi:hypothetical protein
MGREAVCNAQLGTKQARGKALLETSELVFRSEVRGDLRVVVPFKKITTLTADGPQLRIKWPGGNLALELGAAAAAAWAEKIRHPPSRLDKLGVTPDMRVSVIGKVDADFRDELKQRGARVETRSKAPVAIVFFAAETRADLARLEALQAMIVPDGAIWVLRRKGSDAISERDVMSAGKAAGLVDTKVAAFSPSHTAEKLVIPVARRGPYTPQSESAKSPARSVHQRSRK